MLSDVFDPRRNALNAIRLLLAIWVIGWHAFPLSGSDITFAPLKQLISRFSVDGFFAISGFLIVSSWVRNPRPRVFLRARLLRIFPAFWVSLVLTALVFGPLGLLLQGRAPDGAYWRGAFHYVSDNLLLYVNQYDIAGTPTDVPDSAVWNGSMWTLFWEFLCYLGVLALGVAGALKRQATIPLLFVLLTLGVLATSYGPIDHAWIVTGSRFGILFVAGAVVHHFRHRIPVTVPLLVAAAGIVVASLWLVDYRVVAALPVAYLTICLGALGKHPRLQLHDDLSYGTYIYAFPMQQLLATVGAFRWGVPAFALLSLAVTLPMAAASWFLVERPVLRLKRGRAAQRGELDQRSSSTVASR